MVVATVFFDVVVVAGSKSDRLCVSPYFSITFLISHRFSGGGLSV